MARPAPDQVAFDDRFATVHIFASDRVLWLTRHPASNDLEDGEVLERLNRLSAQLVERYRGYAAVVDSRAVRGRANATWEAGIIALAREWDAAFSGVVYLLASAAGALQASRVSRESGTAGRTRNEEDEAFAEAVALAAASR